MSGICALFRQDGGPVDPDDVERMVAPLRRRGPDRTGVWRDGSVGLGHALLATTPEAAAERLPLTHAASGCTITADVRLDNRDELLAALDVPAPAGAVGDAELVLRAYLAWGEGCARRLLGDFAFVIHDRRRGALLCARDPLGVRPLYYHHAAGRWLVVASEPRAILALDRVPFALDEGRIADYLVSELEPIDRTSTFFQGVSRLPPAHLLAATPERVETRRYWTLEPAAELRLPSDEAYARAFLDLFTEAVRCRLRGAAPVGSMLSGGMDSGSIAAVARGLLAERGAGPLATYSAVGPDPARCPETRAIEAALAVDGLAPRRVGHHRLDELAPELERLTWELDEPFDDHMTLLRALYLAARRDGCNVLLDGAGGDVVLGEGTWLARLLRRGRWPAACREARGAARFWGDDDAGRGLLWQAARTALAPDVARWLRERALEPRRAARRADALIRDSLISPDLARRVDLAARLRAARGPTPRLGSYLEERARAIQHPRLTVGRERYDRVAAAVAVEPRDPFLDLRVVGLCAALPGDQLLAGGWPKAVLRRAMAGRLPDAVRWRRGKQHLGWAFTRALAERTHGRLRAELVDNWERLGPYVDVARAKALCASFLERGELDRAEVVYGVAQLGAWLRRTGQPSPNRLSARSGPA